MHGGLDVKAVVWAPSFHSTKSNFSDKSRF